MNEALNSSKKNMDKAVEHMKAEFAKLRVGRASTAMVEGVRVDMYGSSMTLKEVAALTTPDAKTITIQPWDKSVLGEIEKGILAANLGLTPINDGKVVRINMPPMTEDRRKDFVKQLKKYGEEAKIAVRNTRRDTLDNMKKSEASEDEMRRLQDEIQKVTDHFVAEIDKLVDVKSKEVMTL